MKQQVIHIILLIIHEIDIYADTSFMLHLNGCSMVWNILWHYIQAEREREAAAAQLAMTDNNVQIEDDSDDEEHLEEVPLSQDEPVVEEVRDFTKFIFDFAFNSDFYWFLFRITHTC